MAKYYRRFESFVLAEEGWLEEMYASLLTRVPPLLLVILRRKRVEKKAELGDLML